MAGEALDAYCVAHLPRWKAGRESGYRARHSAWCNTIVETLQVAVILLTDPRRPSTPQGDEARQGKGVLQNGSGLRL
jgi:hypothetical protein